MGLKFCNEAIITLQQIWPKPDMEPNFELNNLQVTVSFVMFNFVENVWKMLSQGVGNM